MSEQMIPQMSETDAALLAASRQSVDGLQAFRAMVESMAPGMCDPHWVPKQRDGARTDVIAPRIWFDADSATAVERTPEGQTRLADALVEFAQRFCSDWGTFEEPSQYPTGYIRCDAPSVGGTGPYSPAYVLFYEPRTGGDAKLVAYAPTGPVERGSGTLPEMLALAAAYTEVEAFDEG